MFTEFDFFRGQRRPSYSAMKPALVCQVEELEQRLTCSATPVAAQFNLKNDFGVTQMIVDGHNLLIGAGFSIIGSKGGADSPDNLDSESKYSSGGIMRPFNNNPAAGSIPYSFTFAAAAHDASKFYFTASVGPSSYNFASMSIPIEFQEQYFGWWRSSASSAVNRYDQNPYSYTPPGGGPIYIGASPGAAQWGEIIGVNYTVRVTITSSVHPMACAFVNAPSLATGDRDVEFGFGTPIKVGTRASVSGYVQVFRTDTSILPANVYQSETSPYHQIGRKDGDGWSVNVKDTPGRYLQYGPYVPVAAWGGVTNSSPLGAGTHTATFRLMLDNVTANNGRILTIEVYDSVSGHTLKSMDITRKMFDSAFKYKDFNLTFDASPGEVLEFRTFWWGGSYARQDSVTVR